MGQAIPETEAETRGLVVDRGWGEYWLADPGLAPTRVSDEQVEVLSAERFAGAEVGASEVRFGDQTGELLAVTAAGRWIEIGEDGSTEDVTTEVMG